MELLLAAPPLRHFAASVSGRAGTDKGNMGYGVTSWKDLFELYVKKRKNEDLCIFYSQSAHTEPFTLLTPLRPPPTPLLLCLPLSGQRQQPQTEHSGGPLGDPSARVFEVFLIVLDGVQGRTLFGYALGEPRTQTRGSCLFCVRWGEYKLN